MRPDVKELKELFLELIRTLEEFPQHDVNATLFDQWSLKNVVAHLSGWNKLRVTEITLLLTGGVIQKTKDNDAMNKVFIAEREHQSWDTIFHEFTRSCLDLVKSFETLSEEFMEAPIWDTETTNPREWLQIDIEHLREHLTTVQLVAKEQ